MWSDFFKVLFFHLVGHKWFKSLFLSLFVCVLVQFRQTIFDFLKDQPGLAWATLFFVVYTFEIVKAMLIAKEYVGETRHSIQKHNFPEHLRLGVISSEDSGRIIVYSFEWEFPKKMRVPPSVFMENPTFPMNGLIEHKFQAILISSELVTFELRLYYQNPVIGKARDPHLHLGNFDIVADSNLVDPSDIRSKILVFFSRTWPKSKWGWLC